MLVLLWLEVVFVDEGLPSRKCIPIYTLRGSVVVHTALFGGGWLDGMAAMAQWWIYHPTKDWNKKFYRITSCTKFYFQQILAGNVNTFVAEARNISPPIIARKIRIVPYSVHPRIVCMRVEVYGCLWKGNMLYPSFWLLELECGTLTSFICKVHHPHFLPKSSYSSLYISPLLPWLLQIVFIFFFSRPDGNMHLFCFFVYELWCLIQSNLFDADTLLTERFVWDKTCLVTQLWTPLN